MTKSVGTKSGRTAKAQTVSMMPDYWAFVDERVRELKPMVTSRSHYFQLLVEIDKRSKIVSERLPEAQANSARDSRLLAAVKHVEAVREGKRKTRGSRSTSHDEPRP